VRERAALVRARTLSPTGATHRKFGAHPSHSKTSHSSLFRTRDRRRSFIQIETCVNFPALRMVMPTLPIDLASLPPIQLFHLVTSPLPGARRLCHAVIGPNLSVHASVATSHRRLNFHCTVSSRDRPRIDPVNRRV